MNLFKHERGYTLIVVLLIIILIGIMAPLIITNIMNNSLHFKKSENKIQLTHLANMGEMYMNHAVSQAAVNSGNDMVIDEDNLNPDKIKEQFILNLQKELEMYRLPDGLTIKMREDSYQFNMVITSIIKGENNTIEVDYTITSASNNIHKNTLTLENLDPIIINLDI